MNRVKSFAATGVAPLGKLYAGDLNAIQDAAAAAADLTQTVDLGIIRLGETGLQVVRYGSGEARLTGALRTDGIVRALGGMYAGGFSTSARDAIASGFAPFGLVILNTDLNRHEWNAGTDGARNWQALSHTFDPSIWLSAAGLWSALSSGASANTQVTVGSADVYVIDFADGVNTNAQINFPLPWDFPSGGTLQARFHWTSPNSNTGDVRWGIGLASMADGENLGATFGTFQYVADSNAGANKGNISAFSSPITASGTPVAGELCFVQVVRDGANGADTHTATARLLGVQLKYTRAS
jgi:hypothetical protein